MAASMKRKVIKTALLSRAIVIVLQIVLNNLVPDHDAEAFHYKSSQESSIGDRIVQFLLGGFGKWDGTHFLSIAENGYLEERQYAFFPLLPMMMSTLANTILLPMRYVLNLNSRLLLAATGINITCFTIAACGMYTLSGHVLRERRLAYTASLLFCINPATVFFSSVYTESLFAALTFYGMLFLEQGWVLTSAFTFALSTLTRSNGLVSCGFVLYKLFKQTIYLISRKDSSIFKSILICCTNGLTILISILLIIFPIAAYQVYGYVTLCTDYENIFGYLLDYISGKTIHLPENASPWCYDKPPLLYSYIQNHYWGVGFLKYYQIRKIPNFVLAFPMILLCICAVWNYCKKNWNSVKYLGLVKERTTITIGFLSEGVFVYVVHMLVLLVFATTCINIEVVTRLIASCCPVFYWYVASIIKTKEHLKRKHLKSDDEHSNPVSTFYQYFDTKDLTTTNIFIYFLGYSVIGILLHCNFLPWT